MSDFLQKKWKQNKIEILIFMLYFIFNLVMLLGHELWRDEANVWLMARELSPIQLLKLIKYQGHPCMWYFIVMPFAKLGFPFFTISILSFSIMSVTAILFIWKAPLHKIVKLLTVLSPVFSYYYPVVARNYCLIALLFIILAIQYQERNIHPLRYALLIGLLVQTDTIAVAAAGMISLIWICEGIGEWIQNKNTKKIKGVISVIWIPILSVILLLLQFTKMNESTEFSINQLSLRELLHKTWDTMLEILNRMSGLNRGWLLVWLCFFLVLAFLLMVETKNVGALLVLTVAFVYQAVFSVVIYHLHIWHFISLGFLMIWYLWIIGTRIGKTTNDNKKKRLSVLYSLIQMVCMVFAVCMFFRWNAPQETSSLQNAFYGVYSDGKNTAAYIKNHIGRDELIVSTEISEASTVAAYLPHYDFYYAADKKIRTFASWTEDEASAVTMGELLLWVQTTFSDKSEFYILDCQNSCITEHELLEQYEKIYVTPYQSAQNENYTIYRVTLQ